MCAFINCIINVEDNINIVLVIIFSKGHCGYEDAVFKRTMTFYRRCFNDFTNT